MILFWSYCAYVCRLDENGIQTEIRLKTEDVEDLMEIEIDPVDCKIGLNGAGFYEVIQEIDRVGMETVNIEILAGPKDILFSGHTSTGSVLVSQFCIKLFIISTLG